MAGARRGRPGASPFPLLVREALDCGESYRGFVHVHGRGYRLRVSAPPAPGGGPLSLELQPELYRLLAPEQPALERRLAGCRDVASFLPELKELLDRVSGAPLVPHGGTAPGAGAMAGLVGELEEVGWDRVASLDEGFTDVTLVVRDAAQRPHQLTVHVRGDHPRSAPSCRASLPAPWAPTWRAGGRIAGLVRQFEAELSRHQGLWDALDDIDAHCRVLQPERPGRGDAFRRVSLGSHVSAHIELDPAHPGGVPQVRFMGADSAVVPLREALNAKLSGWDRARTPRENLEAAMGLKFPPNEGGGEGRDDREECAICYAHSLEGVTPEIVCDNPKCAKSFHPSCLYNWLRALPTARLSFNTLFGSCTYCCEPIAVPNVSTLQ